MQNEIIEGQILYVERNSFTDKKNNSTISYCKMIFTNGSSKADDKFGLNIDSITFKFDSFDLAKKHCSSSQNVKLEFEYVKQSDGNFKRKLVSIANEKIN